MSEELTNEVTKAVKKHRNRPDLKNFGAENVVAGDNARYLRFAMASLDLPPIDIADPKQVEKRINDYLGYCFDNDRKPSVIGMCNWLGISRDTLNQWKNGDCRSLTHTDMIRKAYGLLEELWTDYMMNGKVNPASGIFLGKNLFGYKDTQDVVITPNNPVGGAEDTPEIAQKYLESAQTDL